MTRLELIIFLALSLISSFLMLCSASKCFAAIQQLGYDGKRFLKWTKKSNNMLYPRLFLLTFLIFLSFSVINFSMSFLGKNTASYVGFSSFVLFFLIYIYADTKFALKVPAKNTGRLTRLKATFFILTFVFCFAALSFLLFAAKSINAQAVYILRFVPLCLLPLCLPIAVYVSSAINKLYETPRNKKYIRLATERISNSSIKVIAITGSFAKTSVKNILNTLLSQSKKVLTARGSFNTPLGVALTVNDKNLDDYEYLIVEMGARNIGDIDELCQIAQPDIAIITGICEQHLESFLTLDNIINTKLEITKNLKGPLILGETASFLQDRFDGEKFVFSKDFSYKNLKLDENGVDFDFIISGESAHINCQLLGAHNAHNICLAAAVAQILGLSKTDIEKAARNIKFEKHRLELKRTPHGLNILDDSYNANIKGAQAALEVLKIMGKKKCVVTPGIVELGILEEYENFTLGQSLAFCDLVILVGETLIKSVTDGLLSMGFDENKLYIVPELSLVGDILKKHLSSGDCVLFLNDLPDVYK